MPNTPVPEFLAWSTIGTAVGSAGALLTAAWTYLHPASLPGQPQVALAVAVTGAVGTGLLLQIIRRWPTLDLYETPGADTTARADFDEVVAAARRAAGNPAVLAEMADMADAQLEAAITYARVILARTGRVDPNDQEPGSLNWVINSLHATQPGLAAAAVAVFARDYLDPNTFLHLLSPWQAALLPVPGGRRVEAYGHYTLTAQHLIQGEWVTCADPTYVTATAERPADVLARHARYYLAQPALAAATWRLQLRPGCDPHLATRPVAAMSHHPAGAGRKRHTPARQRAAALTA